MIQIAIAKGIWFQNWNSLCLKQQKVNQAAPAFRVPAFFFCSATRFDGGTGAVYVLLKENAHN